MLAQKALLLNNYTQIISEENVYQVINPCFETIGNKTEKCKFGDITYFINSEQSLNQFERCYAIAK
jgi:hypothetical protein